MSKVRDNSTIGIKRSPRIRLTVMYVLLLVAAAALFLLINTWGATLEAPDSVVPGRDGAMPVGGKPDALIHVLVAMTAVVVTGRLLSLLFRYVGQPPVIGEVVGGILLGPSLLGRIWPDAATFVLPPSVAPFLAVISQLGIILYMFLVGLELNAEVLRDRAHVVVAISHASIIVPFVLGAGLALLLYPRLSSRDVSFTSFSLFVGVAMAITAFPVLARILTDRKMHRTRLGMIALACAATDDLTAWCLLALVVGFAQAQAGKALIVIGLSAVFIGFMFVVVRPLATRLLARFDELRLTANVTALLFTGL